eukprot:TRINITY_DN39646_c0_g1_i1.p1 TRINITY_DN39646_c0_g1~~TRINITY_DN39646_c0_g1_i1.p1  ORF type:complete len:306 (-),score=50.84 TRINITY_DN39646_c0_g1_i1:369-1286(-)
MVKEMADLSVDSLDVVLCCLGAYLLLYRFLIRRRRALVQALAQFCCGASLVFFAPTFAWSWEAASVFLLVAFGGLFGTCLRVNAPFTASITIGAYLGGLSWQLGLCGGFLETLGVPYVHGMVLTLSTLVYTLVFCGTPLGPLAFERCTVPVLGAALLSMGLAELVPAAGGVSASTLLNADCAPVSDALRTIEVFAVLALCGVALQGLLLRGGDEEEQKVRQKNDMAKSLLPNAEGDVEDGSLQKWRPESNDEDETNSRFHMLIRAIYAPEGTSQEHLTEGDQNLVNACRKDEFERDRLTWGGGLI